MKHQLHHGLHHLRGRLARLAQDWRQVALRRPGVAAVALLAVGIAAGAGLREGAAAAQAHSVRASLLAEQARANRAQREVNALGARVGELQAQANRLNALGDRLARKGELNDGEFNFDKPVPLGGAGPVRPMTASELASGIARLSLQFEHAGSQLSVLDSLLASRALDQGAVPSRLPILGSYITSTFGGRADPFTGGAAFHKGIDFAANVGDPVLAVADGVVSYAADRSGYGHTVEIDHGNGYVTRYAHNSRLEVQVGDLVRAGSEIAKAGSSGRSTGAHVHFEVWQNGAVVNPRAFLSERPAPNRARG